MVDKGIASTNPREPMELDRRLGEHIRQWRELRGWTQQDLADHCGLSFQQIQKYERGTNRVSTSRLFQIAAAFNISVATFLRGVESATITQPDRQELLSRFSQASDRMDDSTLKRFIGLAESFAGYRSEG